MAIGDEVIITTLHFAVGPVDEDQGNGRERLPYMAILHWLTESRAVISEALSSSTITEDVGEEIDDLENFTKRLHDAIQDSSDDHNRWKPPSQEVLSDIYEIALRIAGFSREMASDIIANIKIEEGVSEAKMRYAIYLHYLAQIAFILGNQFHKHAILKRDGNAISIKTGFDENETLFIFSWLREIYHLDTFNIISARIIALLAGSPDKEELTVDGFFLLVRQMLVRAEEIVIQQKAIQDLRISHMLAEERMATDSQIRKRALQKNRNRYSELVRAIHDLESRIASITPPEHAPPQLTIWEKARTIFGYLPDPHEELTHDQQRLEELYGMLDALNERAVTLSRELFQLSMEA